MKTKIIPFDLELAKKIQAGEIKGKIITDLKDEVRIVCFDRADSIAPIIALYKSNGREGVMYVKNNGHAANCGNNLVLEVSDNEPQEQQFMPFDKVLCRDYDDDVWKANLFSHKAYGLSYPYYICGGGFYKQCIPYEGNENLLGTTDKPKEG